MKTSYAQRAWSVIRALSLWQLLATLALASLWPQVHAKASAPLLVGSQPMDGAREVPLDVSVDLRLARPLTDAVRRALSVTLIGPAGAVSIQPRDLGKSARITVVPTAPLLPDSAYTLVVQADLKVKQTIAVLGFRTRALAASSTLSASSQASDAAEDDAGDERFHPKEHHRRGHWRTDSVSLNSREARATALDQQALLDRLQEPARSRLLARMQETGEYIPLDSTRPLFIKPPLTSKGAKARAGQSSLTGQILRINGKPLSHVTVRIDQQTAQTNADGEFVLQGVPAGERILTVDAQHAGARGANYGRYEHGVLLQPGSNELPYTVWLSRVDRAHAVKLDSPTVRDTVVSHPDIPGLELHIPAGAVVRDADGKIVNEVSITPVPVDKVPFPMPYSDVAVYYTIQPGGARIESADGREIGATLQYPNYSDQLPGSKVSLFGHDPRGRGWYTYTTGKVSDDGARVESSEPFKIYSFAMSSAASSGGSEGSKGPSCSGGGGAGGDASGDPVICASGLFIEQNTDLSVADVVPLSVDRTYRQGDLNKRAFGVGASYDYDEYLFFEGISGYTAQAIQLVLGNGVAVRFLPTGSNKTYTDTAAIFQATEPGPFLNAKLHIAVAGWGHDFVITTKAGVSYGFSYYSSKLKWIKDRFGNQTTIQRDSSNRVIRLVSPNGRWIEFTYASSSCTACITTAKDNSGRAVQYAYDSLGQLKTVTAPENTLTDYGWDDTAHQILTVKDARRNIKVTNVYYSATGNTALDGRVKSQTYADGSTNTFTYEFDSSQQITASEVKDQRGTIRRREYDASRFVVKDILAKGTDKEATWVFQRDPTTHLVTLKTDPLGRQTKFDYDTVGNEKSRTVMYGTDNATTWLSTYEPLFNQPLVSTDPLGNKTTRTYDSKGLLQKVQDDLGHKTTYAWYPNGQLKSTTRWPGVPDSSKQLSTAFGYEFGDLVSVTDPLLQSTRLNVDAVGRVTGIRDATQKLSTATYDGLDRLTQRCEPNGACANMVLDGNGNLTQFTRGTTRRDMSYDAMNRLSTEGRSSGQTPAVEKTITYDPVAGTQTVTEASGRVTVTTFDVLWRPATVKVSSGSPLTLQRTITYMWDSADRLQSVADSVAGSLSYTYDDRFDAVLTETGPTGTMSYAYYANGLRKSATPSGGSAVSYGYDLANRLKTLSQAAGSTSALPASALNVGITYDDADRRQTLTLANGVVVTYGWDDASQLTSITWEQANGATLGYLVYGYDKLGRRTSLTGNLARANMPTPVSMTVGTDGRIATEGSTALQYDANGRLTQDASYKYFWNDLGQLSEVRNLSDNALRASYSYDAIGRRIQKSMDGVTTRYLHDGANPILLQDASGTPKESLLSGGIDEWFSRTKSSQTQHFINDALGSTLRLTDGSGAKVVDYTYDPYGGTTNDNAANDNVFQYTGRENDGLGLYYYRARYLKPKWGRFISQDPIGLEGGDNLTSYVRGNPTSRTDPLGLKDWICRATSSTGEGYSGTSKICEYRCSSGNLHCTVRQPEPDTGQGANCQGVPIAVQAGGNGQLTTIPIGEPESFPVYTDGLASLWSRFYNGNTMVNSLSSRENKR